MIKKEIILAGACRTAIGKFGGSLSGIPAADLGAVVIREAIQRSGISSDNVDEVIMGCVLQAGLGQNIARQSAIKAGIPVEATALTINNVCGSGLKAVNIAATLIAAGEADLVIAGGMENMSAAPYVLPNARYGYRLYNGSIVDTIVNDGLWDAFNNYHMGLTAENVAEKYGITRIMQDEFAAWSQNKCEIAQKAGNFDKEIVKISAKNSKETVEFGMDEFPRQGITLHGLSTLKSVFKPNGTVTAGNTSGINDGAAAVAVMSSEKAQELGIKPLARIISSASSGLSPSLMGIGPVEATKKALAKAGLSLDDIDLIEANEAFAAQSVAVGIELGWDNEKVNVNGGAIALGHPIGASGCRILVTLLHALEMRDKRLALATLCVGGGMGVATIVERI